MTDAKAAEPIAPELPGLEAVPCTGYCVALSAAYVLLQSRIAALEAALREIEEGLICSNGIGFGRETDMSHYRPNCDNSLDHEKMRARAALAAGEE